MCCVVLLCCSSVCCVVGVVFCSDLICSVVMWCGVALCYAV